jgi:surfactin synthase thioesterase subunit
VPLLVFGGEDDATAPPPALEAWRDYSTGAMDLKMFPGGHFFLQTHQPAVLQAIRAAVTALV